MKLNLLVILCVLIAVNAQRRGRGRGRGNANNKGSAPAAETKARDAPQPQATQEKQAESKQGRGRQPRTRGRQAKQQRREQKQQQDLFVSLDVKQSKEQKELNCRIIRCNAAYVEMMLAAVAKAGESGQGQGQAQGGSEKGGFVERDAVGGFAFGQDDGEKQEKGGLQKGGGADWGWAKAGSMGGGKGMKGGSGNWQQKGSGGAKWEMGAKFGSDDFEGKMQGGSGQDGRWAKQGGRWRWIKEGLEEKGGKEEKQGGGRGGRGRGRGQAKGQFARDQGMKEQQQQDQEKGAAGGSGFAKSGRRSTYDIELAQAQNFGDPHSISFDGRMTTYQGTCKQILTRFVPSRNAPRVTPFTVYAKARMETRGRESVPQYGEVEMFGQRVYMGPGGILRINGRDTATPYAFPEAGDCSTPCQYFVESDLQTKTSLRRRNLNPRIRLTLRTEFGLQVIFQGGEGRTNNRINISPPPGTRGFLQGLNGNWNGRTDDDMAMPNGTVAVDEAHFASSWIVNDPEDPNCVPSHEIPKHAACPPAQQQIADRTCAMITDRNAVFGPCLVAELATAAEAFHSACIFDICATTEQDFAITAMEEFAERCVDQLRLETPIDWQQALTTYLSGATVSSSATSASNNQCSENMHWLPNAESTPSCENPVLVLATNASTAPGACVCEGGHVFDSRSTSCVEPTTCGCRDTHGSMHRVGDSWISTDCTKTRTCNADRSISEVRFSCPSRTTCGTEGGHTACVAEGQAKDGSNQVKRLPKIQVRREVVREPTEERESQSKGSEAQKEQPKESGSEKPNHKGGSEHKSGDGAIKQEQEKGSATPEQTARQRTQLSMEKGSATPQEMARERAQLSMEKGSAASQQIARERTQLSMEKGSATPELAAKGSERAQAQDRSEPKEQLQKVGSAEGKPEGGSERGSEPSESWQEGSGSPTAQSKGSGSPSAQSQGSGSSQSTQSQGSGSVQAQASSSPKSQTSQGKSQGRGNPKSQGRGRPKGQSTKGGFPKGQQQSRGAAPKRQARPNAGPKAQRAKGQAVWFAKGQGGGNGVASKQGEGSLSQQSQLSRVGSAKGRGPGSQRVWFANGSASQRGQPQAGQGSVVAGEGAVEGSGGAPLVGQQKGGSVADEVFDGKVWSSDPDGKGEEGRRR